MSKIIGIDLGTTNSCVSAIEVRRSPWRLLYKPDKKELETDNLYDAARSFAMAASAVDSATQSLEAIQLDSNEADPELLEKMLENLRALFDRYTDAESTFWEALNQQDATSKWARSDDITKILVRMRAMPK